MTEGTSNEAFVGTAERTSLPRLILGLARSVRDAPVANGNQAAVSEKWRLALNANDDADLLEGIALFARSLRRLDSQVDLISIASIETKGYMRETISGLLVSVAPQFLPGAFTSVSAHYSDERLLRLSIAGDFLLSIAPEAVPSADTVEAMKRKAEELQSILDRAELPVGIKTELARRLNAMKRALDRAHQFGGGGLMDAAGQLAGITVAARAAARAASIGSEAQSALRTFSKGVVTLLDWVGRAVLVWDLTNAGVSSIGGPETIKLLAALQ